MKKFIVALILCFNSLAVFADVNVTSFMYIEKESRTDPVNVRYLVSKEFIRIDNGALEDDFLLYDRKKKIIYRVNRSDKSILAIKFYKWTQPEFSFSMDINKKTLADAPEISGKKVLDYSATANNEICHQVQLIPDLYSEEMQAFIEYQNVLSGLQVKILSNTPVEMQTPCFLVDQIYNAGDYYRLGLPVRIWHSRGYVKLLKNYTRQIVSEELFVLPAEFESYSMLD
jgi:hypothetical protein